MKRLLSRAFLLRLFHSLLWLLLVLILLVPLAILDLVEELLGLPQKNRKPVGTKGGWAHHPTQQHAEAVSSL